MLWRCSELDSEPQNMVSTQNLRMCSYLRMQLRLELR